MNNAVFEDAFNMLCGDKIGHGQHRTVFACNVRPDLVVKVEDQYYREFMNVSESNFWCESEHRKDLRAWLAPCAFLSPDGRVLLQQRADPIPSNFTMPDKIPSFLTDLKRENFGIIDGRLVCIDYAIVIDNASMRMVKNRIE